MDTTQILAGVQKYVALDENTQRYFSSLLLPLKLRQNEIIAKPGDVSQNMIYVNSGCLMTYFTDEGGHDHVIQFAFAGWWTGDIHSLTKMIPSVYTTKALADSEVFLLSKNDMDELFNRFPVFERYFRIIFQNSLVTHQQRIIQNFSATAEERYLAFQKKYPTLEQFAPLKYIASYLGITPEFLSKIRRKLTEK
jgi:cAMP-binding proteins - catabolite gene activator and regulatory subunit of cAMP-dependent protein kinases